MRFDLCVGMQSKQASLDESLSEKCTYVTLERTSIARLGFFCTEHEVPRWNCSLGGAPANLDIFFYETVLLVWFLSALC